MDGDAVICEFVSDKCAAFVSIFVGDDWPLLSVGGLPDPFPSSVLKDELLTLKDWMYVVD